MNIKTLKELREVLNYERERKGLRPITGCLNWIIADLKMLLHPGNPTIFMYCLRCEEFCRGGVFAKILRYKHKVLQNRTGIELYPGVDEKGVSVNHGKCVVSRAARIGRDCVILSDVTIGGTGGLRDDGAAIIGERVFISTGARIIGKINICDDVCIGANAVVTKDIIEPGTIWGGVPAKIIGRINDRPFIK